jgi:hypothetical protein
MPCLSCIAVGVKVAMTASLSGLPACDTEARGLSRTAYRQSQELGRTPRSGATPGRSRNGASRPSPCVLATEPTADRLLQPPALLDPPTHSLLSKPHVVDYLDTELPRLCSGRFRSNGPLAYALRFAGLFSDQNWMTSRPLVPPASNRRWASAARSGG